MSGFSLKDELFNAGKVSYLAGLFADHLDVAAFEARVMSRLLDLELKERINWIADVLGEFLDADFEVAAGQILDALPPPLDPSKSDDDFGDFIFAPLGEFVAARGAGNVELSLEMLHALTQRFSMEWAIRPFLRDHPEVVLAALQRWAGDESYHVRRLVSEGTRPNLPWGMKVVLPQAARFDLLDRLHSDPTRYVTRSVCNHLNDEAKVDGPTVVAQLAAWRDAGAQDAGEMDWMCGHALRTLVKRGDVAALEMLGFAADPPVEVTRLEVTPSVEIGGYLDIEVEIAARADARLMVDYAIAFVKANGTTAPKVFKLKQLEMSAGETVVLTKKRHLRGDATTFRLYPGAHGVVVQVNGKEMARKGFDLTG